MRREQRRNLLIAVGCVAAVLGWFFVWPLDFPAYQRAAMIVLLVSWMVVTVWIPTRKRKHRKRQSTRTDATKYEQTS